MPTMTYRAFGVPGCLDPLNYKSRITAILKNSRHCRVTRRAPFNRLLPDSKQLIFDELHVLISKEHIWFPFRWTYTNVKPWFLRRRRIKQN